MCPALAGMEHTKDVFEDLQGGGTFDVSTAASCRDVPVGSESQTAHIMTVSRTGFPSDRDRVDSFFS